jgi:hypothetical protein
VKDLIAIQQKRGNVIIRNDQLDMQDEEQDEAKPKVSTQSKGFIRSLLMSPLGVLV